MRYSRKVIVGFIVLLATLMSPRLVFGDDDLVRVTPQIAVEQAQAFFDDVSDEPVTACDPVKMVNSDGESIGYIVRASGMTLTMATSYLIQSDLGGSANTAWLRTPLCPLRIQAMK